MIKTRKTIAIFFGTRPEAIKMAPVIKALAQSGEFEVQTISTGQHREMLKQVVDLFQIPISHDLDVMVPNQTLAGLSSRLLSKIDAYLESGKPDLVLVQGDTTTVLMCALACFYRRIPVGHVEAGLRTGNIWSPFPEEVNRKLVTPLAALHFPPTEQSRRNLLQEGVSEQGVHVTGNTVIDALRLEVEQQQDPALARTIENEIAALIGDDWKSRRMVLITGHRRENFGEGFASICNALAALAKKFPEVRFVYPVHLNPNVKGPVERYLSGYANIKLIPPQAYRPFVALMRASELILTDSGGVQEEAPSLGKPVLVMRNTTERPEGVDAGTVRLVGADEQNIIQGVSELLSDPVAYRKMAEAKNPYGDGYASERILSVIRAYFSAEAAKA